MKHIISFVGRLVSFDFVQNFFIKKMLDKGATTLTGIIFSPTVTGWLPATIPGDRGGWEIFIAACLAGLLGGLQNKAKHYASQP